MVTAAPTMQKSKFLLEGRGIILFLVFLFALILFISMSVRYYNFDHVSVSPGDTLNITGAPGERIFVNINAGSSINGDWASNRGVTLTLNTLNFSTQLVAPRSADWSDFISTQSNQQSESFTVYGSFVLPPTLATNSQAISGQIVGDVTYSADQGGGVFADGSTQINIPVQLTPITSSDVFFNQQLPLYGVTVLDIALLLATPLVFGIYDISRRNKGLLHV